MSCIIIFLSVLGNDLFDFIYRSHMMSKGEEFTTLFRVVTLAYLIAYRFIDIRHLYVP